MILAAKFWLCLTVGRWLMDRAIEAEERMQEKAHHDHP